MHPSSEIQPDQYPLLVTEQGRLHLVVTAMKLTENTALAPKEYEQMLLGRFVRGELTLDEVIAKLEDQNQD